MSIGQFNTLYYQASGIKHVNMQNRIWFNKLAKLRVFSFFMAFLAGKVGTEIMCFINLMSIT